MEAERLIFGNGSDEVFSLLNQTYLSPGDNIVCGQYAFLAYRISALACGAEVKLAREPGYRVEIDALLEQVDARTKLVYVSNPSNPTGTWNTADEIRRLHEALPAHIILVIDEAYAEYSDLPSALALLPVHENVVVLRTLSKAHALAAARIGVAIAVLIGIFFIIAIFYGAANGARYGSA